MSDLIQTENEFFNNKNELRARFGVYADCVKPIYDQICSISPKNKQVILNKLMHTKVKVGSTSGSSDLVYLSLGKGLNHTVLNKYENLEDFTGLRLGGYFTWADILDLKYTKADVIVKSDENVITFFSDTYRLPDKDLIFPRILDKEADGFTQGLVHYLENSVLYRVPGYACPQTLDGVLSRNRQIKDETDVKMAGVYGGEYVRLFDTDGKLNDESRASKFCEELIIDEFINSFNPQAKLNPENTVFIHLIKMWNFISENELTKGLFQGEKGFSPDTKAYQREFANLVRACSYLGGKSTKRDYLCISYDNVSTYMGRLIALADRKRSSVRLNEKDEVMFKYYRNSVSNPEMLLKYFDSYVDFGKNRVVSYRLLKNGYKSSMRSKKKALAKEAKLGILPERYNK